MGLWHIRPLDGQENLCGAASSSSSWRIGLVPTPHGDEVCGLCQVEADRLQEEGDLIIEHLGVYGPQWKLDDRPPEYRNADAFADFLRANEQSEYTPDDLALLVEHSRRPEAELRRVLGMRGIRPAPQQREVRGLNSYWKAGDWRVR